MGRFIDRILIRIMDRVAPEEPEEPEEEQDIEALRERKREILRAAHIDTSDVSDRILDSLKIVKRPFHLR